MQMRIVVGVVIWTLFACSLAMADTVELSNGDLLSGKVATVTADHVVLTSEVLGEVKLPRAKVDVIHFGERKPAAVQAAPAITTPAAPATGANPGAAAKTTPQPPTVDDVLNQLKAGGAGGDVTKMLQKEFPLLQNPEVKAYFDKTIGGLMSGDLKVSDLRQQAIDVRQQVRDLEKELGPEGMAALKPYTSVLDKFIADTEHLGGDTPAAAEPKTPVRPRGSLKRGDD